MALLEDGSNSCTTEDKVEEDVLPCKKQKLEVDELSSASQSTTTSSGGSKQLRKFNAGWMKGRKQWLVYKPEGMYCSLCQKYDQRPYNRDIWNKQPCSRLRLQSIKRHDSSAAHSQSLLREHDTSKVRTLRSDVERTFSQLKLIKTPIRNRMQEQTLDSLLCIAIEGPPLNSFPVAEVVALWASKKQRRLYN